MLTIPLGESFGTFKNCSDIQENISVTICSVCKFFSPNFNKHFGC